MDTTLTIYKILSYLTIFILGLGFGFFIGIGLVWFRQSKYIRSITFETDGAMKYDFEKPIREG